MFFRSIQPVGWDTGPMSHRITDEHSPNGPVDSASSRLRQVECVVGGQL